jgi:hypothetical protein
MLGGRLLTFVLFLTAEEHVPLANPISFHFGEHNGCEEGFFEEFVKYSMFGFEECADGF